MNVLVVARQSLSRDWVVSFLTAAGHVVIGQVQNRKAAVNAAMELGPDLVLLDIGTPNSGGLNVLSQIKAQCPKTKVVLLTVHGHEDDMLAAIENGADGCLMKDLNAMEFLDGMACLEDGNLALPKRISTSLISGFLYRLREEWTEREPLCTRAAGGPSR